MHGETLKKLIIYSSFVELFSSYALTYVELNTIFFSPLLFCLLRLQKCQSSKVMTQHVRNPHLPAVCMLPGLFATEVSFPVPAAPTVMASTDRRLPSSVQPRYILDFIQPHRQKSDVFQSGHRLIPSNFSSFIIFVQKFSFFYAEMWRRHFVTLAHASLSCKRHIL